MLEVSLRAFADDFCLAINEERGKNWKEADLLLNQNQKEIEQYLMRHFVLVRENTFIKTPNLLGTEIDRDVVWCYLVFEDCANLNAYKMLNSILVKQFEDQTNIVNVFYPKRKHSLLFTPKERLKEFPVL